MFSMTSKGETCTQHHIFVSFIIISANYRILCEHNTIPVSPFCKRYCTVVCIMTFFADVYSLLVIPQTIPELEGDLEVNFFCRENNNSFATSIKWLDPQHILYIPGSLSMGGNSRISAERSRLQIRQLVRNDTGIYRCLRSNNPPDFAEGTLLVHGIHLYLLTLS